MVVEQLTMVREGVEVGPALSGTDTGDLHVQASAGEADSYMANDLHC